MFFRTAFNVPQGVNCFDYNPNMNVIATGDVDHMVRLWNPYVKKPVGVSNLQWNYVVNKQFINNAARTLGLF